MAKPADMERASKLIRAVGLSHDTFTPEELACAAWRQAVGKRISAHTRAARLVRDRLVVEVEDAVWQRQLWALRGLILRNLEKSVGPDLVGDLEFRIVPRRIDPGRAMSAAAVPAVPGDEASLIGDPVLRKIYKASRKKALA